jgi:hypothetical protein
MLDIVGRFIENGASNFPPGPGLGIGKTPPAAVKVNPTPPPLTDETVNGPRLPKLATAAALGLKVNTVPTAIGCPV